MGVFACVCVCVLRTLTLKVSIVPSSSWTRQSRSGFGMSVTRVTLPPSQDKRPALSLSPRGDLETHNHTQPHKSVRGFQPVVLHRKHLPSGWHCVVSNICAWWSIRLQWVMHCECEGVTVSVCVHGLCNPLLFGLGLNMSLPSPCCSLSLSASPRLSQAAEW